MDIVLTLARLILVVVFAVAAIGKFSDLAGSRRAMRDFGVPLELAAPTAIALPIAELAVALLLLPKSTAWWGALGALVLLIFFLIGISYNLAHGRRPDCHCFGQIYSRPAGQSTLIRNTILSGVALFIFVFGRDLFGFSNDDAGYSLIAWVGNLSAWQLFIMMMGGFLLAMVALEGWVLLQVLRQNGRLLLRVDALERQKGSREIDPDVPESGLPVRSPAPAFVLDGLYGETVTLNALQATGTPLLLFFMDPDCHPCNELLPQVQQWQRENAGTMTVAVISRGSIEENRRKIAQLGIVNVLLQRDDEVAEAYEMPGTPAAVLVDPDGMIGSPLAFGEEEIKELVNSIIGLFSEAPEADKFTDDVVHVSGGATPATRRDTAPETVLSDLRGRTVRLSDFRGRRTVVLFWNPDCGFCQHLLPDIKAWESAPPPEAPELLVVSMGGIEENAGMGLRSTVVLDQDFTTGRRFGVSGTPSAVLVDEEGRLASEVAMGAADVLGLLGVSAQVKEAIAP